MKVLLSGGSGFIGQSLSQQLTSAGHEVTILDRNSPRRVPDGVRLILMDLLKDDVRPDVIADQDAIIHLMGVNLFRPWTKKYKQAIYDSRVVTGRKLVHAVLQLGARQRPKTFVSASAIGFYGDTGGNTVDELSPAGSDFLANLCTDWEAILDEFKGSNVRTVAIRTGIVIGPGGMVGLLKPFFKYYLGAIVGSGRQLISWISLPDLLSIYRQAVENPSWQGAVNAVAPEPIPLNELTKQLAATLHRPRLLKVPAFLFRPVFGDFAGVMMFSQNVKPSKLKNYRFRYWQPDFASALETALQKD